MNTTLNNNCIDALERFTIEDVWVPVNVKFLEPPHVSDLLPNGPAQQFPAMLKVVDCVVPTCGTKLKLATQKNDSPCVKRLGAQ